MKYKEISWICGTLFIIPLIFIMYQILKLNLEDNKAFGIIGVLVFMSFSLFFFYRRNHIYTLKTVFLFYCVGILGSIIIAYLQAIWLVLFLVYAFYFILGSTSFTKKGKEVDVAINKEIKKRTWYQKILATPTQQSENKNFIIDFIVLMVFIIAIVLVYDTFIK